MEKKYYRIRFKNESALSLGNGENINTDKDILRDSRGVPYIPGTSLAGVYRSLCSGYLNDEEMKKYFGNVEIAHSTEEVDEALTSRIIVYDAIATSDFKISNRDCVGLDEYKVAKKSAKFDFEVLEPGAEFITYIEQTIEDSGDRNVAGYIASAWEKGMSLGAKTMRGLGECTAMEIKFVSFAWPSDDVLADDAKGLNEWLEFDMFGDNMWEDFKSSPNVETSEKIIINLELKQRSGISIRQYTTEVSTDNKKQPDYKQLVYKSGKNDKKDGERDEEYAIIPGTSWAGAFSHQMRKLGAGEEKIKELFGTHIGKAHKSQIKFSESRINIGPEEGQYKIISRNAIDRFTGGAADGALYTEKYVYGETTNLTIEVPEKIDNEMKKVLAATISDLHYGFLAIGGLTVVGRGLFQITKVNDKTIGDSANVYESVLGILNGGVDNG